MTLLRNRAVSESNMHCSINSQPDRSVGHRYHRLSPCGSLFQKAQVFVLRSADMTRPTVIRVTSYVTNAAMLSLS